MKNFIYTKTKKIRLNNIQYQLIFLIFFLIFLCFFWLSLIQPYVFIYQAELDADESVVNLQTQFEVEKASIQPSGSYKIITAYSPSKDETDDTPFITASGRRVEEGIAANNCHPFGQKVMIGGKVYEIWDRMNKKYSCDHYDLFFWKKEDALNFGRQNLEVVIIK